MPKAWSYSSMSLFQQCPKKYYHLRVAKDIVEPQSAQMRYGLDAHKAAEDYVRDGKDLPGYLAYMKEPLDRLKAMQGQVYCEHRMGLTARLQPCGFFDKEVWWRGIADLLVVNGPKASLIDYKTGKNTYPDTKQLELLSLAVFKHFPEVEVVKAGLLFVVHPAFVRERFETVEQEERWKKWLDQSNQLDAAYQFDIWNPKQNFTCKAWCPVLSCEHNGKAR